jgi:hypothetical protein
LRPKSCVRLLRRPSLAAGLHTTHKRLQLRVAGTHPAGRPIDTGYSIITAGRTEGCTFASSRTTARRSSHPRQVREPARRVELADLTALPWSVTTTSVSSTSNVTAPPKPDTASPHQKRENPAGRPPLSLGVTIRLSQILGYNSRDALTGWVACPFREEVSTRRVTKIGFAMARASSAESLKVRPTSRNRCFFATGRRSCF